MILGSIVEVGGLLHRVWEPCDRFGDIVAFCGERARHKLEAQTSLVTCVACLARVANYHASSASARERGYVDTMPHARRRRFP